MNLETLFLDAGGVIVHPNWSRVSDALGRHGVPVEVASLADAEPHAKRELDSPEPLRAMNDAARGWLYFDLVLRHAGVDRSPATDAALQELRAYHARENLWESVPTEVVPALRRLRQAGLRLVLVSNANGRLAYLLDRLGLAPYFDHALDSHHEGVEKPDPRLFRIALERSGAAVETTLHVGDLYHVDVVGARAAGIKAALLDSAALYPDADCPRFPSLSALAEAIAAGGF